MVFVNLYAPRFRSPKTEKTKKDVPYERESALAKTNEGGLSEDGKFIYNLDL